MPATGFEPPRPCPGPRLHSQGGGPHRPRVPQPQGHHRRPRHPATRPPVARHGGPPTRLRRRHHPRSPRHPRPGPRRRPHQPPRHCRDLDRPDRSATSTAPSPAAPGCPGLRRPPHRPLGRRRHHQPRQPDHPLPPPPHADPPNALARSDRPPHRAAGLDAATPTSTFKTASPTAQPDQTNQTLGPSPTPDPNQTTQPSPSPTPGPGEPTDPSDPGSETLGEKLDQLSTSESSPTASVRTAGASTVWRTSPGEPGIRRWLGLTGAHPSPTSSSARCARTRPMPRSQAIAGLCAPGTSAVRLPGSSPGCRSD